jgi:hypothetical protein
MTTATYTYDFNSRSIAETDPHGNVRVADLSPIDDLAFRHILTCLDSSYRENRSTREDYELARILAFRATFAFWEG